jgi:hypothetical protein
MSDDSKPSEPVTPAPSAPAGGSAPATVPSPAVSPPSSASAPATPSTAPMAPKPPAPAPIDYAIGAPKKPFTLPRYTFLYIKMLLGLTILLGMGYFALVALNPKARQWATQGAKDGTGGPTPFKAMNQLLAIPAQAVGKTKDVVAASDVRTGMVNSVVAEEEKNAKGGGRSAKPLTDIFSKSASSPEAGAGKSAASGEDKEAGDASISRERLLALAEKNASAAVEEANKPVTPVRTAPVVPPPPPGPPEMKLGGGITITNLPAPDATPASAPFMYWVASLSVSGVSNSSPARFLMNNKLVREGEEVNKALAVTFERLDATAKVIYFRDKSGAGVTRSY